MIKEALQYLVGLASPNVIQVAGPRGTVNFSDKEVNLLAPPEPDLVAVETIAALADLVDGKLDALDKAKIVCHVEDFATVTLKALEADAWGRRRVFARAAIKRIPLVPFGNYADMDTFAVHLLSGFVPATGDLDYLIGLASNITNEILDVITDSGISQTVSVRRGLVLAGQAVVKGRVALAPYRTFSEVTQPISDFLFRLRRPQNNDHIVGALFEADGGKWKLEAIANVAAACSAALKGVTVIS